MRMLAPRKTNSRVDPTASEQHGWSIAKTEALVGNRRPNN